MRPVVLCTLIACVLALSIVTLTGAPADPGEPPSTPPPSDTITPNPAWYGEEQ